ncbi:hypothetical protein M885DRAFT_557784 [Pelagophyceae sp. CCMP2097]|nr:hypothetical protein M885DRAFT_557784 [Pelagophyceae sp. CCMP2097]
MRLREAAWWVRGGAVSASVGADDAKGLELKAEALNAWFYESGGTGSASVRVDAATGRLGLFATASVKGGQEYVRVPAALRLGREAALALAAEGPALRDAEQAVRRAAGLVTSPCEADIIARSVTACAYLLIERRRGSASAFHAYIDALPHDFDDHPLLWPAHADAELAGTCFLDSLRRARRTARLFVALARAFVVPEFSRVEWGWAYFLWMTRCIGVGQGRAAWCPMVDMTNCASSVHASCSCALNDELDDAVMLSPAALRPGNQIFENYGWSNCEYMLAHGFWLHVAPDDCATARPRLLFLPTAEALASAALGRAGVGSRSWLLRPLVGDPDTGWGALYWHPRLCAVADMRFASRRAPRRASDAVRPFDGPAADAARAHAAEAERQWAHGRNASFLVAVVLSLDGVHVRRAATCLGAWCGVPPPEMLALEDVDAVLERTAPQAAVVAAWRLLASVARGTADEYVRAANRRAGSARTVHPEYTDDGAVHTAVQFRAAQHALAARLAREYDDEAAAAAGPPPPYEAADPPCFPTDFTR